MGAYGFNDDKSKHPIYDEPHAITEKYTYNSATETQAQFLKRIWSDILPLCRKYGANIKMRMTNNSGMPTEICVPMSQHCFDDDWGSSQFAEFIGIYDSRNSNTTNYSNFVIRFISFHFASGSVWAEIDGINLKSQSRSSMIVSETKIDVNYQEQGELPNLNRWDIDFVI